MRGRIIVINNLSVLLITLKFAKMDIRNEDLPVTLQAFELLDNKEIFIAEQVVTSQSEVNMFTTRYTGKLIKAKKTVVNENNSYSNIPAKKRNTTTGMVMIIIIVILLALVIYGFSTGWIQQKFNLNV